MIVRPNEIVLRIPSKTLDELADFDFDCLPKDFLLSIRIASPTLYNDYINYANLKPKSKQKVSESIYKYWVRNCSRPTPFGLFSGINIVPISEKESKIRISGFEPNIRLDISVIRMVLGKIKSDSSAVSLLGINLNNTLYEIKNEYRYLEKNSAQYSLASIEKKPVVDSMVKKIKEWRGIPYEKLLSHLIEEVKIKERDAKNYLEQLIASQIIESEIELETTGIDPLESIIKKITPVNLEITSHLVRLKNILQSTMCLEEKLKETKTIFNKIGIDLKGKKNILQVDNYYLASQNEFNRQLSEKILTQIQKVIYLSRKFDNFHLNEFKDKFRKKYEEGEVLLVEALDADIGVGYGAFNHDRLGDSEILKNIGNNYSIKKKYLDDSLSEFITFKFNNYLKKGEQKIIITEAEIDSFFTKNKRFSQSMVLIGNLINTDISNFKFKITALAGSSCINVLSRFTSSSNSMDKYVQNLISIEEEIYGSEVVFADIIHEPLDRSSNLVFKKSSRNSEILYGGKSTNEDKVKIDINDIYAKLIGDELILTSKSINKRIIPVLSNAHNYLNNSSHIYQFLCDYQTESKSSPCNWDWGSFNSLFFLPRVEYKNLIIKKARWLIDNKDLELLLSYEDQKFVKSLVYGKLQIPEVFYYIFGDRELLINLKSSESIAMFRAICNKQSHIIIEEFIEEETPLVENMNSAKFNNELIIPIIINEKQTSHYTTHPSLNNTQRKMTPNSDWIYLKLYCGAQKADSILINEIMPLVEEEKLHESFHFVRYYDEFSHLRIRFRTKSTQSKYILIEKLNSAIDKHVVVNNIHSYSYDTYIRELERYGGEGIIPSEEIFHIDSVFVLELIKLLNEVEDPEKYRFILALRSIDEMLNDFVLNNNDRFFILKTLSNSFLKEFGNSKKLNMILKKKYFNIKNEIFSHLTPSNDIENGLAEVNVLLAERSLKLKPIAESLNINYDVKDVQKLISSYIHMHFNRLFVAQQRKYELIAYYSLSRYYESQIAIINLRKNNLVK